MWLCTWASAERLQSKLECVPDSSSETSLAFSCARARVIGRALLRVTVIGSGQICASHSGLISSAQLPPGPHLGYQIFSRALKLREVLHTPISEGAPTHSTNTPILLTVDFLESHFLSSFTNKENYANFYVRVVLSSTG